MSQNIDNTFRVSGEETSADATSYTLEQYLNSDGGLTERLLRGADVGAVVGRAEAVRNDADMLADRIAPPSQGSSS